MARVRTFEIVFSSQVRLICKAQCRTHCLNGSPQFLTEPRSISKKTAHKLQHRRETPRGIQTKTGFPFIKLTLLNELKKSIQTVHACDKVEQLLTFLQLQLFNKALFYKRFMTRLY